MITTFIIGFVTCLFVGIIVWFMEKWGVGDEGEDPNDYWGWNRITVGMEDVAERIVKPYTKGDRAIYGLFAVCIALDVFPFIYITEGFSFFTSAVVGTGVGYLAYNHQSLREKDLLVVLGIMITPVWFEVSIHMGIPAISVLVTIMCAWVVILGNMRCSSGNFKDKGEV